MAGTYLYAGLAGDTGPGHERRTGLYRSRDGEAPWELVSRDIDPAPEVRAIATDRRRPGRVTIGTQDGLWRSEDHGEHWARLPAPAPGLAVWSLLVHPGEPDTMLAGYEPCAIHRSTDDGKSWQALPVDVIFPDVSLRPTPTPKRVNGIAIEPSRPSEIYASVEVGGLLRSLDGGASWRCVTDGVYVVDDAVDLHRVAVSPGHPGIVNIIGRIGLFRSADRGDHWRHLPVPSLTDRQPYCRDLVVAPDDSDTLYVALGSDFDGDRGALFQSRDDGATWRRLQLGATPGSTLFGVAIDRRRPDNVYCTSRQGEVFASRDRGETWRANPLPPGTTQVYSFAVG
jgi:photosystem II stability/assembly factor-like uncharacterized protein